MQKTKRKSSHSAILEVDEEDDELEQYGSECSNYNLEVESTLDATAADQATSLSCLLEKDLDMNEGNFNLIKNSKAFKRSKKSKHTNNPIASNDFEHILDDDEELNDHLTMSKRLSEEDTWLKSAYSHPYATNYK